MSDLSVRLTKALEFDAASLSSVTNRDPRGRSSEYKTAYFEGGKFYHARLQPFLEVLIECVAVLEKIKPGYGLDITDNVEYRAKYWADIAIGFQQIASEARVKLQTLLDAKEGK